MAERNVSEVVVLANSSKHDVGLVASRITGCLNEMGIRSRVIMLSSSLEDLSTDVPRCDLAISLGGDGTVLACAVLLKGRGVPILAVNMGTFGFIAETSVDEVETVLGEYMDGKTGVLSRMMLDVRVFRKGKEVFSACSLNDVTVSAVSHARMAKLDLFLDGILAANLRADGMIMATPTGSTAYSLSAGGPIIDASLEAIIINPICPFTMSVRPLVVNADSEIKLLVPRQNTGMSLTCDGHQVFSLSESDEISVRQCKDRALFVENKRRRFIEVLRDKLAWAGGFNA